MSTVNIVKDIHLIWLKGPMPKHIQQCLESILYYHKDAKVFLWMDTPAKDACTELAKQSKEFNLLFNAQHLWVRDIEIFKDKASSYMDDFDTVSPAIQSDVYRLLILQCHAGMYMDLDIFCTDSIYSYLSEQITKDTQAVITKENAKGWHNNDLIYVPTEQHDFINACIKDMESQPMPIRKTLKELGPALIGRVQLQEQFNGPDSSVARLPWYTIHSIEWRNAAKAYASSKYFTPPKCYYSQEDNTTYRVPAVHLWNDLISVSGGITIDYDFREAEVADINAPDSLDISAEACHSQEDKTVTESVVLKRYYDLIDELYGPYDKYDKHDTTAQAAEYALFAVAYCEWIKQVASMYDSQQILLCYRDGYLPYMIMSNLDKYKTLNLAPVWMNRDLAGQVAGFSGPGYQFEPTYSAYGCMNPYKKIDIPKTTALKYLEAYGITQSSLLVVDLTTGYFSALETFQTLIRSANLAAFQVKGCSFLTVTRSSNDQNRLRNDYKAWGHVTVTPQTSFALKALEAMFTTQVAAVNEFSKVNIDIAPTLAQEKLIHIATEYIKRYSSALPTIATALKTMPNAFVI